MSAPFLLDTDIVVDLHELGFWNSIVGHYAKLFLAETIYETEIRYYHSLTKPKIPINLGPLVKKGDIKILKGKITTMKIIQEFLNQFDVNQRPDLHSGDLENLAIIVDSDDLCLCTFDKATIRALSMMELENKGISFEGLISNCKIKTNLKGKYTRKYFGRWVTEGKFPLISKPPGFFKKFIAEAKFPPIS